MQKSFRSLIVALILISLFGIAACDLLGGQDNAGPAQVAMPNGFLARQISAGAFVLTASEHIRSEGQVAAIYIEGDNDEPQVAQRLAAKDVSPNVIYLSRPCCADEYREDKRFSPEVIAAMGKALDDIKAKYKVFGFNLVGYGGGAAVAALLAAQRDDILSLRTVAGTLDSDVFAHLHHASLSGSLNPSGVAAKIVKLSQKHFVGADDKVITPEIGQSFINASTRPDCLSLTSVAGADHEKGWEEKWPELLEQPLEGGCQ